MTFNQNNLMKPKEGIIVGLIFMVFGLLFITFCLLYVSNYFQKNGIKVEVSGDTTIAILCGGLFTIIGVIVFVSSVVKMINKRKAPVVQEYIKQSNGLYNRIDILNMLKNRKDK